MKAGGARHRHPLLERLVGFWADDRGLSVFSALLLVEIFVIPPLTPAGASGSLAGDVVRALLLVSGVHALAQGHWTRVVLVPAALIAIAVDLARRFVTAPEALVLLTGLLAQGLFLAVVLGRTLRAGPVTARRLHGGVAAYLLLGLIWANLYQLVALLRPGAFSGIGARDSSGFMYYSFVTLTTMGYGDVLPVHPVARSLATLEAVTGSLYLAILVSRLVSLAVADADTSNR
jgi:hypothetical protein